MLTHMTTLQRTQPRDLAVLSSQLCNGPMRQDYYFHLVELFNCYLLNVVSKVPFYLQGYGGKDKYVCLKEHTFWE